MAKLKEEHKQHLVMRFAVFDKPQAAAKSLKDEFGVEIDRAQAVNYDPKSPHFKGGKKWLEFHDEVRARFLDDRSSISIAHTNFRLRELAHLYDLDLARGATVIASSHLEQAAKEIGGAYTNKRDHRHSGKDGGPIRTITEVNDMTRDQVLERLAELQGKQGGNALGMMQATAEDADDGAEPN